MFRLKKKKFHSEKYITEGAINIMMYFSFGMEMIKERSSEFNFKIIILGLIHVYYITIPV